MNIQHPTSNIQHPAHAHTRRFIGCSMLDVGCSMFLVLVSSSFALSAQTSTNALPPLSPAYPPMPPAFWEQHGPAILIGGCIFLTLAAIVLWMIFKSRPQRALPPEVVAREALAQLLRRPEDGKVLSEVSQILRGYVIAVLGLPPAKMTTAEICEALASQEIIGAEAVQSISNFLRECDERKFSTAARSSAFTRPGPPEGGTPNLLPPLDATSRALELVARIEKRRTELRAQTRVSQ
jgi:hypothetical protein